jgi:hypothetical protein
MYNSVEQHGTQHDFGQADPRWFCPYRHSPVYQTESYPVRHRCPRCSRQCHQSYAAREHATVTRYLDKYAPTNAAVFRGHLHMPADSTVAQHRATRERFVSALRNWRHRLKKVCPDVVVELRAYTHVTDPDRQHYDYVAYSTVDQGELRDRIRTLWVAAGGREDIALVRVEDDAADIAQTVGYICKVNPRHRDRFYLPADNGLSFVWGTQFFREWSQSEIWTELRQMWFPVPTPLVPDICVKALHDPPQPVTPLVPDICVKASHDPQPAINKTPLIAFDDPKVNSGITKLNNLAVEQSVAAINGSVEQRQYRDYVDSLCISRVLRTTPAEGLTVAQIAHRSGTPTGTVARLLHLIPTATRIQNWHDPTGRNWNTSGWFKSNADPTSWHELSEYAATVCDSVGMDYRHCLRHLAASEFGPECHQTGTAIRPPKYPYKPYQRPSGGKCLMNQMNK